MLKQRVITAAVGIPLLLLFIWLGGWWLGAVLLLLAAIACYEYWRLAAAFSGSNRIPTLIAGFLYICLGFMAFWGVRALNGTIWLLVLIWSTDSAAYFVGRRIGRHKLAPHISPNKTIEGALGGLLAGVLLGCIYACLFRQVAFGPALAISAIVSIIGQLGDLLESKIKRMANVKDSGKIFPGHGGVLDRFDSILLSSMFMYVFLRML